MMIKLRVPKHGFKTRRAETMTPYFQVKEVRSVEPHFQGIRALVNPLTDKRMGFVANRYNITTHQEASNIVKDFIKSTNLPFESLGAEVSKGGAKFFETLIFPSLKFNLASVDNPSTALDAVGLVRDDVIPTITINNSYDKSMPVSWTYGAYQVKCSNGLAVLLGGSTRVAFRHTQVIDTQRVYDSLMRGLETSNKFVEFTYNKLNGADGFLFLDSFLKDAAFSHKFKKTVLDHLQSQGKTKFDYETVIDPDTGAQEITVKNIETNLSAYAIYNVLTENSTHGINNRIEREKTNRNIAKLLLPEVA